MNLRPVLVGSAVLACLALSACAGTDGDSDTAPRASAPAGAPAAPTPSPSTTALDPVSASIDLALADGVWEGAGKTIKARQGEPVMLRITSDVAGGLHVHSTPEQAAEFKAGVSEVMLTFERPGVVEIESHEPNTVVLQVEVR